MVMQTRQTATALSGTGTTGKVYVDILGYYDRVLLDRLQPELLYGMFGEPHPLPEREGSQVTMRRYSKLAVSTTALTEGVTPAGSQLTHTDLTAIPLQYGDFITITDAVKLQSPDPIRTVAVEILGEQAGESWDILHRNVLLAGTNVISPVAADTAESDVDNVIDASTVQRAVNLLERNDVKKMKGMTAASTKVTTSPLRASYIGITHPDSRGDLEAISGWVPVEKYAAPGERMMAEAGYCNGVRWLFTSQCYFKASAGGTTITTAIKSTNATNADVYRTVILGKRAYGITTIGSGKGVQTIFQDFGSGGTSDALKQRCTQGWKGWTVAKILDDTRMVIVYHAVSNAYVETASHVTATAIT